jgi:hypothetical protein
MPVIPSLRGSREEVHYLEVASTVSVDNVGGTTHTIAYDTKIYDTSDMWEVGDPYIIAIPSNSIYQIDLEVDFSAQLNDSITENLRLGINPSFGATMSTDKWISNYSGGIELYNTTVSFSTQIYLRQGDTFSTNIQSYGFRTGSDFDGARLKVVSIGAITL